MSSIILLVGPKGAGKSTLGEALARALPIAFLRVEPLYLDVMRTHTHVDGVELERRGFDAIRHAIDDLARHNPIVCFESTGTARVFFGFLHQLRERYAVYLVRVTAPASICLERVRSRSSSNHIPVSDERVQEINRIAAAVALDWHLELDTSNEADTTHHVERIERLLVSPTHPRSLS
jgi:shikimate kinase